MSTVNKALLQKLETIVDNQGMLTWAEGIEAWRISSTSKTSKSETIIYGLDMELDDTATSPAMVLSDYQNKIMDESLPIIFFDWIKKVRTHKKKGNYIFTIFLNWDNPTIIKIEPLPNIEVPDEVYDLAMATA